MIGIFTTVKNNYDLTRKWLEKESWLIDVPILLLDVGSNLEEVERQRNTPFRENVDLIIAKSSSLQSNYVEAFEHFKRKGIEWVLFSHQDNYCVTKNFHKKINHYILKGYLDNFGMVGFNTYHDSDVDKYIPNHPIDLMTLSRTPLERTDGHYRRRFSSTFNYKAVGNKADAIAVFMPYITSLLINRDTYLTNIEVDNNFQFFHALDDVAMQFLNKGLWNVCLTKITMIHDQRMKLHTSDNLILKSPQAKDSEVVRRYGRIEYLMVWKEKWGFEYSIEKRVFGLRVPHMKIFKYIDTIAIRGYKKIRYRYIDSLVDLFYLNNPSCGAVKMFFFSKKG